MNSSFDSVCLGAPCTKCRKKSGTLPSIYIYRVAVRSQESRPLRAPNEFISARVEVADCRERKIRQMGSVNKFGGRSGEKERVPAAAASRDKEDSA